MAFCASEMRGETPRDFARMPAASRLSYAGWLACSSLGVASGASTETIQNQLLRLLDTDGATAVRRLRGDFTIAHLSKDRTTLRLYRGVTSTTPLFWRWKPARLQWATNPLDLLDGQPGLSDIAVDLLPMLVAERGFPQDRSWFVDVHRLPAGMFLTLRSGTAPVVDRFDSLVPVPDLPRNLTEVAAGLRARIRQACARALAPDDPALVLLSGGIDSGAVAEAIGRLSRNAAGFHFTMDFPGFEDDRKAAESVATATGLEFLPYDLSKHVRQDGDYVDPPASGALPQTHPPLRSPAAAAEEARTRQARFVFSGLMGDQIFAHDLQRGLFDAAGLSLLNPMAVGEPPWHVVRRAVQGSFAGAVGSGPRRYVNYFRALLRGDAALALPNRDVMVHPIGLTEPALQQVTAGIRRSAEQAAEQLRASRYGTWRGRGLPPGVSSLAEVNGFLNSPNLTATVLNDLLPKQCFSAMPFADRDVVEYALALPNRFRLGFGYGVTVDKLALRIAYGSDGLPAEICRRTQQMMIGSVAAVYVHENFERCRTLLGPDCRLCELGVLDASFVSGMSGQEAHRYGDEIARLCVLERWLRTVAP